MEVWNDWVVGVLDGSYNIQLFAEDVVLEESA